MSLSELSPPHRCAGLFRYQNNQEEDELSYYTKVLKCPKNCSEEAQAHYFPAQNELLPVIVCGNCGVHWSSIGHNLPVLIEENFLFDLPEDLVEAQK